MIIHKIPTWVQHIFSGYVWQQNTSDKSIYLTFDDGPVPEITEWVLAQLKAFNAMATFFMVGQNIERYNDVFFKVVSGGHAIGNHTYSHLKGWRTSTKEYIANVAKCAEVIQARMQEAPSLFRPPYGRIKPRQASLLRNHYNLIMWSVLSADYDAGLSQENCLQRTIKATEPGSIIVFHDSKKAWKNLEFVLPKYLAHFAKLGYSFKAL